MTRGTAYDAKRGGGAPRETRAKMKGTWTVEGQPEAAWVKRARYIVLLPAMMFVGVVVPARDASNKNEVNEIGNRKVAHRSIVSQEREIATGKQFCPGGSKPGAQL